MKLREKITEIIEQSCSIIRDGDTKLASMEILKYMDDQLDLDGNGWFDNDKEMSEFVNR